MIRIVGLSATLPNYKDVASFLGVPDSGLFYFDASYRPVPLAMEFVGTTDKNILQSKAKMDDIAFQKVSEAAGQLQQVRCFRACNQTPSRAQTSKSYRESA